MGGNVKFDVSGETVQGRRIHNYDITDTLSYVSEITGISKDKLMKNTLGSAYKSDSSGDIDIAIDDSEMGYEELRDYLKTSYDWVHPSEGFKILNLLVPIQGKHSKKILSDEDFNGYVQVDLMFGNPQWMKFSYFSPGKKSKYKGIYRTGLIRVVTMVKTEFAEYDDDGSLLAKVGAVLDNSYGLMMQKRLRRNRKDGKGLVKSMSKVDDAEWNKNYPETDIKASDINDPDEAAAFLFGNGVKAKDLNTFEQVRTLVKKLPQHTQYMIDKLYHQNYGMFIDETPTS